MGTSRVASMLKSARVVELGGEIGQTSVEVERMVETNESKEKRQIRLPFISKTAAGRNQSRSPRACTTMNTTKYVVGTVERKGLLHSVRSQSQGPTTRSRERSLHHMTGTNNVGRTVWASSRPRCRWSFSLGFFLLRRIRLSGCFFQGFPHEYCDDPILST